MTLYERYPAAAQLLGAYLHQDWDLDCATPDEAVTAFIACGTADRCARTAEELRALLEDLRGRPDDAAEEVLYELGCYYPPSADGFTTVQWLEHVIGMLEADL